MMHLNLLDSRSYATSARVRIFSFPIRLRAGLTWLRLVVQTSATPELARLTAVRKVNPFVYHRTPRAPWEDK